jgi:hypothetical protein
MDGVSDELFPSFMNGVVYKRVCVGDEFPGAEQLHNYCTDEILGHYEYRFKGELSQLPVKQLIEDLQLLLKAYEEAGIK